MTPEHLEGRAPPADMSRQMRRPKPLTVTVLLMTYLAMPFATRALKRWLYPAPPP